MKNIKLVLAGLLIITSIGIRAQTTGELIVPLSDPSKRATVRVDINKGSITVIGTARKDIKIFYKVRASKSTKSKEKDGLKRISSGAVDLQASESNNRVKIGSDSWNQGLDLTIEVPSNVDLNVETYNSGDIEVDNINGEVVSENYNGKITLTNISGSAVASTYNGRITVTLNNVTPDTPMSFTTYNGTVDITMPTGTKGNLKLKSTRGDIYSGFDMQVSETKPIQKKDDSNGVYKVYLDDWTRATINGGGPDFTMKNYNGDIYIRTK
jgi:hypothetical protein